MASLHPEEPVKVGALQACEVIRWRPLPEFIYRHDLHLQTFFAGRFELHSQDLWRLAHCVQCVRFLPF
jgi:hypothetical protein